MAGRRSHGLGSDYQYLSKLPQESLSAFFLCTFSLLGKLSLADGKVSTDERIRIQLYVEEELHLPSHLKNLALQIFEESLNSPLSHRDYLNEFKKAFPHRVQLQGNLIRLLIAVSKADGFLGAREDAFIRSVALLLDFSEDHYEQIKAESSLPH